MVLSRAFGKNTDLWIGQKISVSRGQTTYGGKPTACITFEAILAPRIAASSLRAAPGRPSRAGKRCAVRDRPERSHPIHARMEVTPMYVCKGCGREQNDEQFYSHSQMASGHLSFCKDCIVAKAKAHRAANLDRIRAYDPEP